MIDNILDQFGADIDIDQDEVLEMAEDAAQTDLADDDDVRHLIRNVCAMVGREIDPDVEDRLTQIITSGDAPTDMASLMDMLK